MLGGGALYGVHSLLRGVANEFNALLDVALKVLVASLEELLLGVVGLGDNVDGLLGTVGAKLDRNGEEVHTSGLHNGLTALNTGQVDERGLDDALLALGGLEQLLGEAILC